MPAAARKINGKEVLADIKGGMTPDDLMRKHGISSNQYDLLIARLREKGLIGPSAQPQPKTRPTTDPRGGAGNSSLHVAAEKSAPSTGEHAPKAPSTPPGAKPKQSEQSDRTIRIPAVTPRLTAAAVVWLALGAVGLFRSVMRFDAFNLGAVFPGLLGLCFIAAGLFYLGIAAAGPDRGRTEAIEALAKNYPLQSDTVSSSMRWGSAFLATLWNGALLVIVTAGPTYLWDGGVLVSALLAIAGVVGLILFILAGASARKALRPRILSAFDKPSLKRGQAAEVSWVVWGRVGAVERLHLSVECVEETEEDDNGGASVELNVLYESPIAEATEADAAHGSALVILPPSHPATSTSETKRIGWWLRVRAETQGIPEIEEEFPFTVT